MKDAKDKLKSADLLHMNPKNDAGKRQHAHLTNLLANLVTNTTSPLRNERSPSPCPSRCRLRPSSPARLTPNQRKLSLLSENKENHQPTSALLKRRASNCGLLSDNNK